MKWITGVSKLHNNRIKLSFLLLKQINNGKCVDGLDLYLCKSPITWISSYFLFTMILIYFFPSVFDGIISIINVKTHTI